MDPIIIDIPKHVQLEDYAIHMIITNMTSELILKFYKNVILSTDEYICKFVKAHHTIIPEFIEKVPEAVLYVYANKKDKITNEMFNNINEQHKRDFLILYIHEFNEPPPEWMCVEPNRNYIIYLLNSQRIKIPSYLYDFNNLSCSHYSADAYYMNTENEIKCKDCFGNNTEGLKCIYNIKCLICFEERPSKIQVFDCGHTICSECSNRIHSCPLCDRQNENVVDDEDYYIDID